MYIYPITKGWVSIPTSTLEIYRSRETKTPIVLLGIVVYVRLVSGAACLKVFLHFSMGHGCL